MSCTKRLSGRKCCIKICSVSKRKNPEARLFSFRKTDAALNNWINACEVREGVKYLLICNRHFERKCFGKKLLFPKSLPSLYLYDQENSTGKGSEMDISIG